MKKTLLLNSFLAFYFYSSGQSTSHLYPCSFYITDSIINASCFPQCNGGWIAYAHSGTPPYNWGAGPTNNSSDTVTGLCAGTYTIAATDNNGCAASTPVVITQPSAINLSAGLAITQPSCPTCCDGAAQETPSGGTTPYSYSWTPGGQTTSNITGLCHQSYTICVTDKNGCTICDSINFTLTGINNLAPGEIQFSVYPDPNNGIFTLSTFSTSIQLCTLEIFDILGRPIMNKSISLSSANINQTIDISAFGKGLYIIAMKSARYTALKKIVVF